MSVYPDGSWENKVPLNDIKDEYYRALKVHGPFRSRAIGLAGLVEEVGEVAKAILEGNDVEAEEELKQVAAIAIRFLVDFPHAKGDCPC